VNPHPRPIVPPDDPIPSLTDRFRSAGAFEVSPSTGRYTDAALAAMKATVATVVAGLQDSHESYRTVFGTIPTAGTTWATRTVHIGTKALDDATLSEGRKAAIMVALAYHEVGHIVNRSPERGKAVAAALSGHPLAAILADVTNILADIHDEQAMMDRCPGFAETLAVGLWYIQTVLSPLGDKAVMKGLDLRSARSQMFCAVRAPFSIADWTDAVPALVWGADLADRVKAAHEVSAFVPLVGEALDMIQAWMERDPEPEPEPEEEPEDEPTEGGEPCDNPPPTEGGESGDDDDDEETERPPEGDGGGLGESDEPEDDESSEDDSDEDDDDATEGDGGSGDDESDEDDGEGTEGDPTEDDEGDDGDEPTEGGSSEGLDLDEDPDEGDDDAEGGDGDPTDGDDDDGEADGDTDGDDDGGEPMDGDITEGDFDDSESSDDYIDPDELAQDGLEGVEATGREPEPLSEVAFHECLGEALDGANDASYEMASMRAERSREDSDKVRVIKTPGWPDRKVMRVWDMPKS